MKDQNFNKFYDIESYLFGTVTQGFKEIGLLTPFDFFCIVIWKANRSKSKIAKKLLSKGFDNLTEAVTVLTKEISMESNEKARLRLLICKWGFRLPMASAILTVLYPQEFTVYDVRVCGVLGDYSDAHMKLNFESLWERYDQYRKAVQQHAPQHLTLRDKDRWLWGKSFAEQLGFDISRNFVGASDTVESDA